MQLGSNIKAFGLGSYTNNEITFYRSVKHLSEMRSNLLTTFPLGLKLSCRPSSVQSLSLFKGHLWIGE